MFAEEVVPVTVTDGLTPICVIEPDSLAFGEVEVGQSLDGTFMVTNGGEVRCWGSDDQGQIGDGGVARSLSPRAIKPLP